MVLPRDVLRLVAENLRHHYRVLWYNHFGVVTIACTCGDFITYQGSIEWGSEPPQLHLKQWKTAIGLTYTVFHDIRSKVRAFLLRAAGEKIGILVRRLSCFDICWGRTSAMIRLIPQFKIDPNDPKPLHWNRELARWVRLRANRWDDGVRAPRVRCEHIDPQLLSAKSLALVNALRRDLSNAWSDDEFAAWLYSFSQFRGVVPVDSVTPATVEKSC